MPRDDPATADAREEKMDITVVIPLFNEAESLRELHERIVAALEASGKSFEVLFIDDGSRDGSFDELRRLRRKTTG